MLLRKAQAQFIQQSLAAFYRPCSLLFLHSSTSEATTESCDSAYRSGDEYWRLDTSSDARQFVQSLHNEQKRRLLSALHECVSFPTIPSSETALADHLFRRVDKRYPHGLLDREEFITALRAHKLSEEQRRLRIELQPVHFRNLVKLAVATGVPFIGFGFLDNLIMILAGESIEHMFGMALGLSIMAAAALGNLISDVAGVCLADTVEATARKFFGLHAPVIPKAQQNSTRVRVSRMMGSAVGVAIGCALGMIPLLWYRESIKVVKV